MKIMEALNRYPHGTVWGTGKELMLIISSDRVNVSSPIINCVLLSNKKGSKGIEVSIGNKKYQINCNQIHTITRGDLTDFYGAISAQALSSVKTSLRALLGMEDMYQEVERTSLEVAPEPVMDVVFEGPVLPPAKPGRKPSAKLSPKKKVTKGLRAIKAKSNEKISAKTGKPVRQMNKYSDEDKKFLRDTSNTTDDIMKRFGFTVKRQAHSARTYARTDAKRKAQRGGEV